MDVDAPDCSSDPTCSCMENSPAGPNDILWERESVETVSFHFVSKIPRQGIPFLSSILDETLPPSPSPPPAPAPKPDSTST